MKAPRYELLNNKYYMSNFYQKDVGRAQMDEEDEVKELGFG
jgi:hypothetical protein